MADLKAEKERLELVSHQKGHADKLKGRITDLQNEISTRELMHEETKRDYEILVAANQKFYDSATKFRETYTRVENLEKTNLHIIETRQPFNHVIYIFRRQWVAILLELPILQP